MRIQDMEDLKQQYLDEMKSSINEIQIKDYRNEKIDIEIKINELKENFNGMSIEINKKKKLQQLEQVANLSTYPSRLFNSFCYDDDDDDDDEEINETDFDPEEEICLVEKLLYDNSSPQPLEELNPKVSDAVIESFSPSPILVEDSDFLMEEIDIFLTPN
ncbi:hypothetical protein Tco_1392154 [Tanacetum coccineum]